MSDHDGEIWRTIRGRRVRIDGEDVQKQLSLIFGNKKERKTINVDSETYERLRSQIFQNRKKYKNGKVYFINLDNILYKVSVDKHLPMIHANLGNFESIMDELDELFKEEK